MAYTVTLSSSILIQDTGPAVPVTVAQGSITDQLTNQTQFLELAVDVAGGAVDQLIDLATPGFQAQSLYITTDQLLTMKQGSSTFAQPIRSVFVGTYPSSSVPASLKFSNPGSLTAHVKIILGSL